MKRYFVNNAVVLPDKPFTRDINAQNKLAFITLSGDNATILLHNKKLETSRNEAGIERDDYGWFIHDFYDEED